MKQKKKKKYQPQTQMGIKLINRKAILAFADVITPNESESDVTMSHFTEVVN